MFKPFKILWLWRYNQETSLPNAITQFIFFNAFFMLLAAVATLHTTGSFLLLMLLKYYCIVWGVTVGLELFLKAYNYFLPELVALTEKWNKELYGEREKDEPTFRLLTFKQKAIKMYRDDPKIVGDYEWQNILANILGDETIIPSTNEFISDEEFRGAFYYFWALAHDNRNYDKECWVQFENHFNLREPKN